MDLERGEVYFYRSKSSADDRLPITNRLDRELRAWMTAYVRELGDQPLSGDMYLFPARMAPKLRGGNEPGERRIMTLGPLQPHKRLTRAERFVQKALKAIGVDVIVQEGMHTLPRSSARVLFEHIT